MPTPRDRQARVATWAAFFVQGLCFATLLTHVIDLQHAFGLSDGDLTLVLLLVPLIAGVGSVAAAPLAARYGSAPVLRLSQLAVCAVVVLMGWNGQLAGLYVLSAAFGLFVGAVDAAMNMQAVAVERRYGMSVLTGFHAVWSVGSMLGAGLNSAFRALEVDLAWAFSVPMVLGALVSLALLPRLYGAAEERVPQRAATGHAGEHAMEHAVGGTAENAGRNTAEHPGEDAPAGPPAREGRERTAPVRVPWRPIIPLCLAMAFLYVGDAAVSNYSTVYMEKALAASEWLVPLAYFAYQAAMLLARVPGDLAVRRHGPAPVVRAGAVVGALGALGVVIAPGPVVAVLAFGLVGVGLSVIAPQSFSAAGRLGAGAETAIARVNLFNYVGFVVGAAVVGTINDTVDVRTAFVPAVVLIALIVPLAGGFRPRPATAPAAS
ncbi:MFS transporter [Planomonospora parontospora]|uniref:MFS transporter n=1 Tax=Planomonospora parontospora TaxID=58119 RepID=UPI0016711994|nr:MFS transporter [Planomonospora parontospora]GGL10999.1 MFS transporter [Planomonospora parontospora subsp. antibiotica]GII14822.1 MFS transporter [Planomonospora parontospora subsp. antibiotica]